MVVWGSFRLGLGFLKGWFRVMMGFVVSPGFALRLV